MSAAALLKAPSKSAESEFRVRVPSQSAESECRVRVPNQSTEATASATRPRLLALSPAILMRDESSI